MCALIGQNIELAASLLKAGRLVAIPTETVYGLAANALNQEAVASVFTVKNRPTFDPLIVHVSSIEAIGPLALSIPQKAYDLLETFSPGPLTLLLPKSPQISDLVTAASPFVGIRIPSHPMTRKLLEGLAFPLAAPSANPFGYISPTTAQHVFDQLGTQVPYILDGDRASIGLESTIIGFEEERPTIYRFGGLTLETIEHVVGNVSISTGSSPHAPGQLKSHYAPKKPIILGNLQGLIKKYAKEEIAVLSFNTYFENLPHQYQLTSTDSLSEAAHNLFHAMRILDDLPVKYILAEMVPDKGLGRAINDRLMRASAQK